MERAEILMDRSKKQPIFENIPMQSGELSQDAFFHPKEVKAQADFTRKIISSKMTGVLLSQAGKQSRYSDTVDTALKAALL